MSSLKRLPSGVLALFLAVLAAGCGIPGTIGPQPGLRGAGPAPTSAPLPPVTFPADEAPHTNLTEWWYYTGHLHGTDASGSTHDYGFELTFFQTLRGQFSPYYAAHYAVTDLARGQFHYDQRAGFEPPMVLPAPGSAAGFNLHLDDWTASGLNGHDHLGAAMANYKLDASLTATKPPVLHGGNGIITYGQAGFSYYYSRTRMLVEGTLLDHGQEVAVMGQAWMDHQWGNFVSLAGSGWDWYSIQLADNTEYMLYIIRDAQKRPLATFGTFVRQDGVASEIPPGAIRSTAAGSWRSPVTGGVYPSGWTVALDSPRSGTLTLTPLLRDQELVTAQSTGVAYWEGAVSATGELGGQSVRGEGYVELTGYASVPSGSQSAAIP